MRVVVPLLALLFANSSYGSVDLLEPGFTDGSAVIPGRFIVTLTPDANARQVAADHDLKPDFVYSSALNGFAGSVAETARAGMMSDRRVVRIEPDARVWTLETQTGATWGLDRVDQRVLPLNQEYSYSRVGTGVHVYIIDTGIRLTHQEFGGRASFGFDALGGTGADCNGHGTHVAGTVGGATFGIAKNVSLVAVRVLDCKGSGTISGVIAGLDWVVANRVLPAVANLSLGAGASASLDEAVSKMINSGVATAVAAGNSGRDACKYSPSRVTEAMTIGAIGSTDTKASWSNYGKCVDWFAPGVSITSAWNTTDTTSSTISGTSMATPHTAGAAALYLEQNPTATPTAVREALWSFTTKKIVLLAKSVNNHLLNTQEESTVEDARDPATVVTFPANGDQVLKKSVVVITASAMDGEGPVTRVEFFAGSNQLCTDQVAPFSCAWTVPGGWSRSFNLISKAFDINGNSKRSAAVFVTSY